jgi:DNA-binding transcriptional MerR regulator
MKNKTETVKEESFLNYLGISEYDLISLYPKITTPLVKLSDIDINARNYFNWTSQGLIESSPSIEDVKRVWVKLSLVEVLWVKVIQALRDYGFPIKEIKTIKETLFKNSYADLNNQSEELLKTVEVTEENKAALSLVKEALAAGKKNSEFLSVEFKSMGTVLGGIMAEILIHRCKMKLLLYKKEKRFSMLVDGYSEQESSQATIDDVKRKTFLSISINGLLADFLEDDANEKFREEFGLISEQEKAILKAMRDNDVCEIVIKKDDGNNITITTMGRDKLSEDDVKLVKRILRMNAFEDVRVVLRNYKHIYLENTTKTKIPFQPIFAARPLGLSRPLEQKLLDDVKPNDDKSAEK